jgi:hypothetical protein
MSEADEPEKKPDETPADTPPPAGDPPPDADDKPPVKEPEPEPAPIKAEAVEGTDPAASPTEALQEDAVVEPPRAARETAPSPTRAAPPAPAPAPVAAEHPPLPQNYVLHSVGIALVIIVAMIWFLIRSWG